MANQTEFNCVSCETTFDPAPNGGFCPDCNTPHPDYEAPNDSDGTEEDGDDNESDSIERITDADDSETIEKITDADDAPEGDDAEDEASETESGVDDVDDDEADTDDEAETAADGDDGDADQPGTIECQSCDSAVDASAAFCPSCGTELEDEDEDEDESEADESVELTACPDCGNSVDDESFCPNCGTDLDAVRAGGDGDDAADDAGDDATADGAADDDREDDDVPEEVTLEIDGEPYTFGDGDVFGRRDEEWLADLVSASGGRDEARYISSEHLEFSAEDDGVYVTDVSTNGTKLNGTAMDGSEEKLADGDTLELADRAEIDVNLS